jgi:hypothetical protein
VRFPRTNEYGRYVERPTGPYWEQTEGSKWALYSLFPLVCYLIGTLLFSRFSLD